MKKNEIFLVSIGLATYNGSATIKRALDSLLSQTYKNIELIISDNASTDNTPNICREYAKKDKRIKYIRQKRNIGAINNFNFVFSKATGKYFMWAADDDLWDKNFIKTLTNELEKEDQRILAISAYLLFSKEKKIIKKFTLKTTNASISSLKFYLDNSFEIGSFFYGIYRNKTLKKIKGLHVDHHFGIERSSDILTVYKMLLNGTIKYVNEVLFMKRDSGNFLDAFELLENHNITNVFKYRIKRYFMYYLFNYFDYIYFLKYSILSTLSNRDKFYLCLLSTRNFLIANKLFWSNTIKGTYCYFKKYL